MYYTIIISHRTERLQDILIEVRVRFIVSHIEERDLESTIFFYDAKQQRQAFHFLESEGAEILECKKVS